MRLNDMEATTLAKTDKTSVRASKGFYGCIAEIGLKRGWWKDEGEFWRLYDEIEFRKRETAFTASNIN